MNRTYLSLVALAFLFLTSCVSKKKFTALQGELATCNEQLGKCGESLNDYMARLSACESERNSASSELNTLRTRSEEQLSSLRAQLDDCKMQRDKSLTQVGDLAVMSKDASENMKTTLAQLLAGDLQLAVRVLQLGAGAQHLGFGAVRAEAHAFELGAGLLPGEDELGDVLHPVDQVADRAVGPEHR